MSQDEHNEKYNSIALYVLGSIYVIDLQVGISNQLSER